MRRIFTGKLSEVTYDLQVKLVLPKGSKPAQIKQQIELPRNKYSLLEPYLQMFYNSSTVGGRSNGQHLILLTGAEQSGKTSLVRESLAHFRNRKLEMPGKKQGGPIPFNILTSPEDMEDQEKQTKLDNEFFMTLEIDFDDNFMMKPEALFHHLHTRIIKDILQVSGRVSKSRGEVLLDSSLVKQIVLSNNSHEYIFIFIKDVVFGILNGSSQILFGSQGLAKLELLNDKILDGNSSSFFGPSATWTNCGDKQPNGIRENLYEELVKNIAEELKMTELQASITLFMSVFKKIQFENRPQSHINKNYQDGIQTTTFLFSILNHFCGFGNLNKITIAKVMNQQKNPFQKYFIGKGNHIDVVLVLYNFQKLTCFKTKKFSDWLDNILIQLHNFSNIRTHFPMIIEIDNTCTLRSLQQLGRMEVDNPSIMEIPGYFKYNLFKYSPASIYNEKTLERLRPALGRNPSTWNELTLEMAKGLPMADILSSKAAVMQRFRNRFDSRINKMFIEAVTLPYLDNNTFKYYLMEFMGMFVASQGYMKSWSPSTTESVYYHPLFMLFFSNKLLYHGYYQPAVSFSDQRYFLHVKQYIQKAGFKERAMSKAWMFVNRPFFYFNKELRYSLPLEKECQRKRFFHKIERNDYMLREAYGELSAFKAANYYELILEKYNV